MYERFLDPTTRCPHCQGNLASRTDSYGTYISCMNCSRVLWEGALQPPIPSVRTPVQAAA